MERETGFQQDVLPPMTTINSGLGQGVAPEIYCLTVQIVNVVMVGDPEKDNEWVLIDAGMPNSADLIIKEAEERFGANNKPQAIILTHGHFDHVGALMDLVKHWDVPVYAHPLEIPYLTGKSNYPPGDPTVGGGFVATLSPMFPNHGIDMGEYIKRLPQDGTLNLMHGWRWIHTPGHTPGHISFFRERDRALIVGDAFVTVKQESLYKVMTQQQEISGPPKYFTPDWQAAENSVKRLASLKPRLAVTGHGVPMSGEQLDQELQLLVRNFKEIGLPEDDRSLQ